MTKTKLTPLQSETVKRVTHGARKRGVKDRTYSTWKAMKLRCYNKNVHNFKYYGGKGITVCDRWIHSYPNFLEDMGPRPENKTIDRIDSSKGYFKENCRWATSYEQSQNTEIGKLNMAKKTAWETRYLKDVTEREDITEIQRSTLIESYRFYQENKYPCSQKHLSDLYKVNRSTIMKRVNRLVELGLLLKTPDGQVYPHFVK